MTRTHYSEHIDHSYHCSLCLNTPLTLIENWRKDLIKNHKIVAILKDLSKAFDCMPHDLLIAKFKAYGVHD